DVVTTSWGRCARVPSREEESTPSAFVDVSLTEYVPSPVINGRTLNCAQVFTDAFPIVASGSASAAGAVFHVMFSDHVCEATRDTAPPDGDGVVTYSRRVAAVTTSVPTPETVKRRSPLVIGELSEVRVVRDP